MNIQCFFSISKHITLIGKPFNNFDYFQAEPVNELDHVITIITLKVSKVIKKLITEVNFLYRKDLNKKAITCGLKHLISAIICEGRFLWRALVKVIHFFKSVIIMSYTKFIKEFKIFLHTLSRLATYFYAHTNKNVRENF